MQYKYKKERKPLFPKKQKEIKIKQSKTEEEKRKMKKAAISSVALFLVVAIICGSILYINGYARTTDYPGDIPEGILIEKGEDGSLIFSPHNPMSVFIFYPEDRTEFTAYEKLMVQCAKYNVLCVLLKMPLHQIAFGKNAADKYADKYSEYDNIYVGGHGKGGTAASDYAFENPDKVSGVILLGSYSESDISALGLTVLSIYGSEDKILDMDKYGKYQSNLPDYMTEHVIEGGNHSRFGSYGRQKGDGTAYIEYEEQLNETSAAIYSAILKNFRYE